MPIWCQIICIIGGVLLFVIACDMIKTVIEDLFNSNVRAFKNKYQYKIYRCKEKLRKYEKKINGKISYLEYKSIYCENLKILHEKNLNNSVLLTIDEFMKINKKKGK